MAAAPYLALLLFHVVFFRRFYFQNPYVYCTSEPADTAFPSLVLLGRQRSVVSTPGDPYYYPDYAGLPFLSSYYPPHRVVAWLSTKLSLNQTFITYCLVMVLHFYMASCGVYMLLHQSGLSPWLAFFGATTLSYCGYAVKQNSCINYTVAWMPVCCLAALSHSWVLCGISLGMSLLAGYWPLALYTIPLAVCCWLWPSLF